MAAKRKSDICVDEDESAAKRETRRDLHDYCGIHRRRASSASGSWTYEGEGNPSTWYHKFPACSKKSQSPIDIPKGVCNAQGDKGKAFTLGGLKKKMAVDVVNNGHSIQANLTQSAGVDFTIEGIVYIVEQFHFHWGKKGSDKGSEHTIGGQAFPLELHIVAYNKKYKNVGDAADKRGLAVLGFLFKEGKPNLFLKRMIGKVPKFELKKTHQIPDFSFNELIGQDVLDGGYYRYAGSLTTPPCYEGVAWTLFREQLSVSAEQLNVFRTKTGIPHNYRPVQALNGRKITCY